MEEFACPQAYLNDIRVHYCQNLIQLKTSFKLCELPVIEFNFSLRPNAIQLKATSKYCLIHSDLGDKNGKSVFQPFKAVFFEEHHSFRQRQSEEVC